MADRGTHGPFFGGPKFLILATSTAAYYAPSPGPEHRTPRPSRGSSRIYSATTYLVGRGRGSLIFLLL